MTVKEFIEILLKQNQNATMYHKNHGIWEPLEYEDIEINEDFVGIDD